MGLGSLKDSGLFEGDKTPGRFQWVDLQDRLSPKASGSQQPAVPIALKTRNARSLEGGYDELTCG
jgi:hypothetical protein